MRKRNQSRVRVFSTQLKTLLLEFVLILFILERILKYEQIVSILCTINESNTRYKHKNLISNE